MLIGVKKRFVFIANSKTASTSIEHSLVGQAEIGVECRRVQDRTLSS